MVGMGIYTTIGADSGLAETIGIPILTGVGAGMLYGMRPSSSHLHETLMLSSASRVLLPRALPASGRRKRARARFLLLLSLLFCREYSPLLPTCPNSRTHPPQVWGIAIGASVLQNELNHRLPPEFLERLPTGVDLSYAAIPTIRDLPEPLKDQVRQAFGESIAVIWKVMVGILGIGFLASLFMADVPLHDLTDEKWALKEEEERGEDKIELASH